MNQIKQLFSVVLLLSIVLACNKDRKNAKRNNQLMEVEHGKTELADKDTITMNQHSVIEPIHKKLHASLSKDVVIRFERTACFGSCPSYILTIHQDGKAKYEGLEWAPRKGLFKAEIDQEIIDSIRRKAEEIGFFSLQDVYDNEYITDLPSAITTLKSIKYFKTVVNRYQGPETLRTFERFIDEQINEVKWQEVQNDQ
mgnify:CR=1 FL=1